MSRTEANIYCVIAAIVFAIAGGLLLDFGMVATSFACACCAGIIGGVVLYINNGTTDHEPD